VLAHMCVRAVKKKPLMLVGNYVQTQTREFQPENPQTASSAPRCDYVHLALVFLSAAFGFFFFLVCEQGRCMHQTTVEHLTTGH
jgi:hypothetical protein